MMRKANASCRTFRPRRGSLAWVLGALLLAATAWNVADAVATFPRYPRPVVARCGDAPLAGPDDPCSGFIVRALGQAETRDAFVRATAVGAIARACAVEVAIVLQLLVVVAFAPRSRAAERRIS